MPDDAATNDDGVAKEEESEAVKAARNFLETRYNKLDPEVRRLVHHSVVNQTSTSLLVSTLGPRFAVCAFIGTVVCGAEEDEKITPPFVLTKGHPLAVAGLIGTAAKEIVDRAVAMPKPETVPTEEKTLKIIHPED